MKAIDFSKISITAKMVAYLRQYSDIPFAQDVAAFVHAEEAILEITKNLELQNLSPEKKQEMKEEGFLAAPALEARYKGIALLIRESGIKQVLELASGFSLRGLAMCSDPSVRYVETDLEDLNCEKVKMLEELKVKYRLPDYSNHWVATANATDLKELEAACATLDQSQPILIVNEGLLPYLSMSEQDTVTRNVRQLLSMFNGGAWITADFASRAMIDSVTDHGKRFREAISTSTDRKLYESAFESDDALTAFIEGHGFSCKSWYQLDLVKDLYSAKQLGLAQSLVERMSPIMKIWLLSPI